jgi:hypothetical protein
MVIRSFYSSVHLLFFLDMDFMEMVHHYDEVIVQTSMI